MSIADEARAEARKRWPEDEWAGASGIGPEQLKAARRVGFIDGAEWQASRKPEAAPSDTDRLLSDEELDTAYYEGVRVCAETTDDDGSGWDTAGLRAVESAVLSRTSQPVQVEVTPELEELRAWKSAAVVLLERITVQGRPSLDVIDTMMQHARPAALGGGDHAE